MMFRLTAASLLTFAISSQAVAERFLQVNSTEVCNICGDGNMVTLPDAIVSIPDVDDMSCANYEASASGLDADMCDALLQFTSAVCGCTSMSGENTTATEAPGGTEPYICYVCGEGMMVTLPDSILSIPTQPDRSCADYEYGGLSGQIPESQCPFLLAFTVSCGCAPGDASPVPLAPPAEESEAPVAAPTVPETPETPADSACGFGYRFAVTAYIVVFTFLV
jgi:hypothetical protein